jgi:predicted dehydrogenase
MRRNEPLAKDYAKRHGIEKYYSSANDLIHDESIDAIYTHATSRCFVRHKLAYQSKA